MTPTPRAGTDGVVLAADSIDATSFGNMVDIAAGAPSATVSGFTALNYLYEAWRNRTVLDGTNSEVQIFKDDASTILCEADVSDDGTDFTRGEYRAED